MPQDSHEEIASTVVKVVKGDASNFKGPNWRNIGKKLERNEAAAEEDHWVVFGSVKHNIIRKERVAHGNRDPQLSTSFIPPHIFHERRPPTSMRASTGPAA